MITIEVNRLLEVSVYEVIEGFGRIRWRMAHLCYPGGFFFSLKGTNIHWRGYIYLWLCTYTLMNVLSIGNIFYMCTSIIVCSLSWYFILKGYITIFTFFSLFVYFYIYLSLYLCLIFSPILYGRVAHDIVYFHCLHGVGGVLLTTDSYFSMQGSLFFIFFSTIPPARYFF